MPRQYQTPRHELLARRDKSALPYPAHSKADVKAARNLLYLHSKGVLPGYEPVFTHYDEQGEAVLTKRPFELGPRYATVLTNSNIQRQQRIDNRRFFVAAMQA